MKKFKDTLGLVPAIALFAMMLLTFCDVIGRKIVGRSITGSVEVTELLMIVMVFTMLPVTSLLGGHIVFDLLDRVLRKRWRELQYRLSNLATGLVFVGAGWIVSMRAERALAYGDITSQYAVPLWPFHYMIALALLLTALAHFYLAVMGRQIIATLR